LTFERRSRVPGRLFSCCQGVAFRLTARICEGQGVVRERVTDIRSSFSAWHLDNTHVLSRLRRTSDTGELGNK
jgi:hypothetical protein